MFQIIDLWLKEGKSSENQYVYSCLIPVWGKLISSKTLNLILASDFDINSCSGDFGKRFKLMINRIFINNKKSPCICGFLVFWKQDRSDTSVRWSCQALNLGWRSWSRREHTTSFLIMTQFDLLHWYTRPVSIAKHTKTQSSINQPTKNKQELLCSKKRRMSSF